MSTTAQLTYGLSGLMLTRTDPPGGKATRISGSDGDSLFRVELDGRSWIYDALLKMRTATNLDGGTYTYDIEADAVTDANGWFWSSNSGGDELSCTDPGGCIWSYDGTIPQFTVTSTDGETNYVDCNCVDFNDVACHWEAEVEILSTDEVAKSTRRILKIAVENGLLPATAKYTVKTTRHANDDLIEIAMQSRQLPGARKDAITPISAEEIAGALLAMRVIYDLHEPSRTTDRTHFYDINYNAQPSEYDTLVKVHMLMS